MKLSVHGTGYVGLVTGACLAEKGHSVVCVDVGREKVEQINRGESPIYEPGLRELLQRNIGKRLQATTDFRRAALESEISLIAVGTPFGGGEIDLTYIREVSQQIGGVLREKGSYHLVVVKSTVVPGTTETVVLPILEASSGKRAGRDFGVGMNPEFLTEGEAIQDFMVPDRIVLGGIDERSIALMEQLYDVFPGVPQVRCNPRTAEMIKYSSNALLATLISFSNELGNLCAALGNTDVADVMKGLHLSKYLTSGLPDGRRITAPITSFIWAGCGFGGSCLPKDVKALIAHGQKLGQPMPLLQSVLHINAQQPSHILALLKKHFSSLEGLRVAVLGLAFRPDTSDMRESPAITVIQQLLAEKAVVQAYDPAARQEARKIFPNGQVRLCVTLVESLAEAEAVVLITSWEEFRQLPELLKGLDRQPLVVDGRRILDPKSMAKYEGIGC